MSRVRTSQWPMTTLLPLAVCATILVVSLVASAVSVVMLQNFVNSTLEQKAAIFLDGFAGHIAQSGSLDAAHTQVALRNALEYQSTLGEAEVAIAQGKADRLVVLNYPEARDQEGLDVELQRALAMGEGAALFSFQQAGQARLTKVYDRNGQLFALSALFDAGDVIRTNQATIWIAIGINAALALVSIAVTFLITRRIAFSLRSFSQRLAARDANQTSTEPRTELEGLESALAIREQSEADRSLALETMAQTDRDALLARVAAVLAHEVRNPLAGILSALSTIRRFGDDRAVREETLDIVESGLRSLERIASVTLATYRRREGPKLITASDIQDLELLIAPEARKKGITLVWHAQGANAFVADADAIRQIMVNLLLNACKASPQYGCIDIEITVLADDARLSVSDHGPGLPGAVLDYLRSTPSSDALPPSRALGISVISTLVQDIGARLSVQSRVGEGTTITVIVPLPTPATRPAT